MTACSESKALRRSRIKVGRDAVEGEQGDTRHVKGFGGGTEVGAEKSHHDLDGVVAVQFGEHNVVHDWGGKRMSISWTCRERADARTE